MFANSRDVADFFGKRHADVMEAIVGMRKSPYTPVDWFQIVPYINEQNGQQYACCDMSQAGFTMLVVGFRDGSSPSGTADQDPGVAPGLPLGPAEADPIANSLCGKDTYHFNGSARN